MTLPAVSSKIKQQLHFNFQFNPLNFLFLKELECLDLDCALLSKKFFALNEHSIFKDK